MVVLPLVIERLNAARDILIAILLNDLRDRHHQLAIQSIRDALMVAGDRVLADCERVAVKATLIILLNHHGGRAVETDLKPKVVQALIGVRSR